MRRKTWTPTQLKTLDLQSVLPKRCDGQWLQRTCGSGQPMSSLTWCPRHQDSIPYRAWMARNSRLNSPKTQDRTKQTAKRCSKNDQWNDSQCYSAILVDLVLCPVIIREASSGSQCRDAQPSVMQTESLIEGVYQVPPLRAPRIPWKTGRKDCTSQRGWRKAGERKQGSYGLSETEVASMRPACACTRSSVYKLWLLTWCFCGTSNSLNRCVSVWLLPTLTTLPPVGLPFPASCEGFCLLSLYIFCPVWLFSLGGLIFFWLEIDGIYIWGRQELGRT